MEKLYVWIRSLVCYFLFLSVLDQLLPNRKYAAYIRLFGGMILILLVFTPLTGGLHIEERIARYYEKFVFQNQASDLKEEILGVEQKHLSEMIDQYEKAIAYDVEKMAEDEGLTVQSCEVEICRDDHQEQFGQVKKIGLQICEQEGRTGEKQDKLLEAVGRLRRKIISYYELEERYVEVQIVERKG
ncbi:MAG: stage III sporulation protein AF [Brotaphodocola sp.]